MSNAVTKTTKTLITVETWVLTHTVTGSRTALMTLARMALTTIVG